MPPRRSTPDERAGRLRVRVPDHVVYREFAEQTVALNLETGRYHGLNPSAATMLEALRETPDVGAAAERLASVWDVAPDVLLADLLELCGSLESRGLLETDAQA